jgi:sugar/nucleoside kinase (ribokinase family)
VGVQTSSTVLPIRPNGERPALHVIGANGSYGLDDAPWEAIEQADFLHLGGPEFIGPEAATEILRHCREHGTRTSMDILADGWPELLEMIAPALEHVDYMLPNDDQAMKLTGSDEVVEAARALLGRGVGLVAVTCGAEGSLIVSDGEVERVPALEVEVVDTTGCGDAYTAGFLYGLSIGREPREAGLLGSACASLVAGGLGTDAGDFDGDAVVAKANA